MRTFRTRTTTAAATAFLAALSLTACQNGGSDAGAASGTPAVTASTAPAGAATQADAKATPEAAGTAGTGDTTGNGAPRPRHTSLNDDSTGTSTGAGTGAGTGDKAKPAAKDKAADPAAFVTCTSANTRVTVTRPTRPINHLLITAENTGSRTCLAYAAPLLRFDDEQAATGFVEGSRPQAVVTLAPGESAYASVILSGERAPEEANGRVTKRLGVLFAARDASGSVGAPATVKLPAGTYKTDDAAVTYWQSSLEDALTF
ncbi:DUF4232 domain-containing protein [Streptomyces fradiae]|uniref:DUF4232 domain-containing protein n=1 Tax=Streptomyces fradiae TaxID=1906 RepID=UPI002943C558|nr:DUF4232 domain-containing protein [Streptomyces fradiae]WOI63093.1 DUF4232 domain-containing protein [Streptomyces fradiae]